MRTMCRLILGIAVLAAAGVVSAQQPDPQPPPSPVPETQVTPAPLPPDIVPPTEQTSATPVLRLVPVAPDLVVTAAPKAVKKGSSSPAKKSALATASKKPTEKPATPETSSQAKETAAAASASVTADSSSPPPPGAVSVPAGTASPVLSQKPPPAVDPVVQAEMDKKLRRRCPTQEGQRRLDRPRSRGARSDRPRRLLRAHPERREDGASDFRRRSAGEGGGRRYRSLGTCALGGAPAGGSTVPRPPAWSLAPAS